MDLATAQKHLDDATAAYTQALSASQVSHAEKSIKRQDIAALLQAMRYWQRVVNDINNARNGGKGGVKIAQWNW